jgi:hypothetical protein
MNDFSSPSPYVQACQEALAALQAARTPREKAEAADQLRAVLAGQQRPLPTDWQRRASKDEE